MYNIDLLPAIKREGKNEGKSKENK